MPCVTISHSDGEYRVREVSEREAAEAQIDGGPGRLPYVEDAVLRAWRRHQDEHAAWGAHWRAIDDERHVQRRFAELAQLEEAKTELAEAKVVMAQMGVEIAQGS